MLVPHCLSGANLGKRCLVRLTSGCACVKLQSWAKLIERNSKCAHISPFSFMKTRTRLQKCFPFPFPSLSVDLGVWRFYMLLFMVKTTFKVERGIINVHDQSYNSKSVYSFDHDFSNKTGPHVVSERCIICLVFIFTQKNLEL